MKSILTHPFFLFLFLLSLGGSTMQAQCPEEVTPVITEEVTCSFQNPQVPPDEVILEGVDNPENAIVIWDPAIFEPVVVEGGCEPQVVSFPYSIGCELDPDLMIPGGQHNVETYPVIQPPEILVFSNNGECQYELLACPEYEVIPSSVDPSLSEQTFTVVNPNGCSENFTLSIPPCPVSFQLQGISYLDYTQPFGLISETGVLCYDYEIPPSAPLQILNVCLIDSEGDEYWSVRNLVLEPFPDPVEQCYHFDLSPIIDNLNTIPSFLQVGYLISDQVQDSKPVITDFQPVSVQPLEVNFSPGLAPGTSEVLDLTTPTTPFMPTYSVTDPVDYSERGCTVPNIDLDSTNHPPGPDYAGDWNACGPASTANSFQWLRGQHPVINDRLDEKFGSGAGSHRDLLESMSEKMEREAGEGVSEEQMLQGKLGLIDECKLPVQVKFQSIFNKEDDVASPDSTYGHVADNQSETAPNNQPNKNVSLDWILQEMEAGEDVELNIQWYNPDSMKFVAGHAVVLTGIEKVGDDWKVSFKDDTRQEEENPDALRHATIDAVVIPDDFIEPFLRGMIYLPELNVGNNFAFVGAAYSESYDPLVTFLPAGLELLAVQPVKSPFLLPDKAHSLAWRFQYIFDPGSEPFIPPPYWLNLLVWDPVNNEYIWAEQEYVQQVPGVTEFLFRITIPLEILNMDDVPDDIEFAFVVSDTPRTQKPEPIPIEIVELSLESVSPIEINIADNFSGNPEADDIDITDIIDDLDLNPNDGFELVYEAEPEIDSVRRGCNMPSIDLDSLTNGPTADYAGDWNACAPAATANSFQWLRGQHPTIDSLLTEKYGEGDTSHRKLLEAFSDCMEREDRKGAFPLNGKLAFVDKCQIPVRIKFQSNFSNFRGDRSSPDPRYGHEAEDQSAPTDSTNPGGAVTMEWLLQEMKEGEDVELDVHWWNPDSMKFTWAHAVVLTGVKKEGDNWKLYYKDDPHQERASTEAELMEVPCLRADIKPSGWIHLPGLDIGNNFAYITSAYSESYDSTVTFDEVEVKTVSKTTYSAPFNTSLPDRATIKYTYQLSENEPDPMWLDIYLVSEDTAIRVVQNTVLERFEDSLTITTYGTFPGLGDLSEIGYLTARGTGRTTGHIADLSIESPFVDIIPLGTYDHSFGSGIRASDASLSGPPPTEADAMPSIEETDTVESVRRICTVPNLDLDSMAHPPTPEYAGDWNACAPTSTANSFQWLRSQHNQIDSLLKEKFGEGDTSLRKLMMEFSAYMDRDTAGEGVLGKDIVEGKLALVDACKLPISVKFQSIFNSTDDIDSPDQRYGHSADNQSEPSTADKPNGNVTMEWLLQEMEEGEDVELNIQWWNPDSMKYVHGHAVVLTDILKIGDDWQIYFKDDAGQTTTDPDSLRHMQNDVIVFPDTFSNPQFRCMIWLPDLQVGNNFAFIGEAYSESYDSTVTFCPDTLTLNDTIRTPGIYQVKDDLCINTVVETTEPVIFQSQNGDVKMGPGAEFPEGSDVTLRIADCDDDSPSSLLPQQEPPAAQIPPAVEFQTEPLQQEAEEGPQQLTLYPNPAYEQLNFVFDRPFQTEEQLLIRVFDNMGKLMHSQESLCVQQGQIDISALPAGLYFIRVEWPNGKVTGRFVKL